MRSFDICIIGNGALGLSTAYSLLLKNPTLHIAVIGPSHRPGCASTAAGAMLGAFGEITKLNFDSKYGQAKMNMAIQSARMWPNWIKQINSSISTEEQIKITLGTYILLNTETSKREEKNFAAIIKALNLYQEPYTEIDSSEVPGLNPIDNCRPLRSIFLPNEGFIDPFLILNALNTILKQNKKVKIIDGFAKKILYNESKVIGVETHQNEIIHASQIVLAAGAYSQPLIDQIPIIKKEIPLILAGAGTSMLIKCPDHKLKGVIRSPNRTGACGIHIMPRDKNTLFMGSSNGLDILPKTETRMRDAYYLSRRAMEQFDQDFYKADILKWFTGNRPAPIDTFPLIGETSIKGLWLLTGTYRDGFHNAPLIAESMANQILYNSPLFDHPFHPERSIIQTMTQEESVNEFVDQYYGSGYEDGMDLPKVGWSRLLQEMLYKKGKEIYKELEIDIGIPFDVLIMLELKRELIPFFREYYQSIKVDKLF